MTELTGARPSSADGPPIMVGDVTFTVAQTRRPRNLDIDATVVSVGTTLAASVRASFAARTGSRSNARTFTPTGPRWSASGWHARQRRAAVDRLRHDSEGGTLRSSRARSSRSGRPRWRPSAPLLLATGALRFDPREVAAVVVPAALDMVAELSGGSLSKPGPKSTVSGVQAGRSARRARSPMRRSPSWRRWSRWSGQRARRSGCSTSTACCTASPATGGRTSSPTSSLGRPALAGANGRRRTRDRGTRAVPDARGHPEFAGSPTSSARGDRSSTRDGRGDGVAG